MPFYTQEEYQQAQTARQDIINKLTTDLQYVCTQVAIHKPILFWGRTEAAPWGCILDEESGMEHCDECPVSRLCPYPHKSWSK